MLRNLKSFNVSETEEKVLSLWKEKHIFEKSLQPKKKGAKTFRFWEGPPYANGRPGIHHVLARVFKDIFLRYKTMDGYVVPRKAGWDTHGLPIEIEVEKLLGINSKTEVKKLGIENFNQKAKEVVFRFRDEFEKLTDRIGYWLDLKNAYVTYLPEYIESLWYVVSKLNKKGFLKEFYRVVAYCPRCQTPLSNHELGQPGVYKTVSDPSVYVKFKISGGKNEYLLIWTTTPWTLPANVAVAVHEDIQYSKYEISGEYVWAYRLPANLGASAKIIETKKGKDLIGLEYEPLYKPQKDVHVPIKIHSVVAAEFVSTEEGTGFVHIAPSFGEDDFNLIFSKGVREDYVLPHTLTDDGKMAEGIIGEGLYIKKADLVIIDDLTKRGLLLQSSVIEHEYPFCWRCSSALIYFAKKSWFFEVSRVRKQLVDANEKTTWIPSYLKEGRFGNWIADAKDWSISRDRFWGTPLPIWRCESCNDVSVVESVEELNTHRVYENTYFLMRHGEARANVEGWIASGKESGSFVSKLTQKGKKQVEIAAKKLLKEKIDIIIASPYKRTQETAHIVAQVTGAKVIRDKHIGEIEVGEFNHKPILEYEKFFENLEERLESAPPKGESLRRLRERMYGAIQSIDKKYRGKRILIVSHGDPLWMLEAAMRHVPHTNEVFGMKYIQTGSVVKTSLDNFPTNHIGEIDIHRPYVDAIALRCEKCGGVQQRIPDIADVWFDSGAMPFAQEHWPFDARKKEKEKGKSERKMPENFPADLICEGIDQTRGWFYTLMATSVMLGLGAPYKNVISLGLIHDKNGQKMSKSRGNVVDPWAVIDRYGIDSLRWYFYTINDPGEPKNFDENEVGLVLRRFILTIYNSFVFLHTYGKNKINITKKPTSTNALDIWICSRLATVAGEVTGYMEQYDALRAAQALEYFAVEDLSRWYIRRSRRRLQRPSSAKDYASASATLAYVLKELSLLLAPFIPFFSEALYQSLKKEFLFSKVDSVHLEDWPLYPKIASHIKLEEAMKHIRDIASAVLAKRSEEGIKVRQPLGELAISYQVPSGTYKQQLLDTLADEVNVQRVVYRKSKDVFELDTKITPELKTQGTIREVVRVIQGLRQDAGYVPKDTIEVAVEAPAPFSALLGAHQKEILLDVGAKRFEFSRKNKSDAQVETKIDDTKVWIGIRKV